MAGFIGGSAWSMSRDIAEGFVLVTERTFKQMSAGELGKLGHEIERFTRELRGGATATEETAELQKRQRRIQRLNAAMTVLRSVRLRRRGA